MKIKKLNARGFSHDLLAVFVVVVVAIVGTAAYVGSHADTPATGAITSALTTGTGSSKTNLCLNMSNKDKQGKPSPANGASIDAEQCTPKASEAQTWQLKPTQKDASGNQEYAILYNGGNFCVGVNAPHGVLALNQTELTAVQAYEKTLKSGVVLHKSVESSPEIQLFNCHTGSFSQSFQQWKKVPVANSKEVLLTDVTPALPTGLNLKNYGALPELCMDASADGNLVRLSSCTGNPCVPAAGSDCPAVATPTTGMLWTVPTSSSSKPTRPTPPKPVITLTATPMSVAKAGSVTLTWSVLPTPTTCSTSTLPQDMVWSVGNNLASGNTTVQDMQSTTTFKLTCTGQGGSNSSSVKVTVKPTTTPPRPTPKAPTVTLTAKPSTILKGSSTTLSWTVTNATTCQATSSNPSSWNDNSKVAQGGSGSVMVESLQKATSFSLSCKGLGGTTQQNVLVTISPAKING